MQNNIYEKFIGCWKLQSVIVKQDNNSIYPFGKDVKGILFYSDKYMSVQIMMLVNYPLSDEVKKNIHLEELAQTLKTAGYMGYFGTYDIDEVNKRIIHHIEGSIAQPLVGGDEIRNYRFEDGNLILSKGNMELTWFKE